MIAQTTLLSVMDEMQTEQFIHDLLWLHNDWDFRQVFRTSDNTISILASPLAPFYLLVDVSKRQIAYMAMETMLVYVRNYDEPFRMLLEEEIDKEAD